MQQQSCLYLYLSNGSRGDMEVAQIGQFLSDTLSPDATVVRTATDALDRLSLLPDFPFTLLYIAAGNENQGKKVAAATYLKNFTRRNIEGDGPSSRVSKEFKDQLMRVLFQVEPVVLKVLVEMFRIIVVTEFVKYNSWPELITDLRSAIQNSNLISHVADGKWKSINALTVLHAVCRPFQYFLNPKVAKEPVPTQLDRIVKEVIVPLLAVFHHLVNKALADHGGIEMEMEKVLLILCKCIYFTVRSHMPSALLPQLPSLCHDLIGILGTLNFDCVDALEEGYSIRLKTGKRILLILSALITRHRKYTDKLMPDIINCVYNVVKYSKSINKLDFLSERIISLAFDVISHVLETGPGWRLVSPHFLSLLDSAIFPALVLNEKDVREWEEDPDEYIRKNLPSDLEEISGWREDLFTARKSATNLLGVISLLKGPTTGTSKTGSSAASKRKKGEKEKRNSQRYSMGELVVLPFLAKFLVPSDANASQTRIFNNYFGVLMAYGGLLDFLREQKPEYTIILIRTRILPLYAVSTCPPYLVAAANWVLGELASCLPEEMCADIYSSLVKALATLDRGEISNYPVRVSAAGAIAHLIENDYSPPNWLPLLEVVLGGIGKDDEDNSVLFQLLCSVVDTGNENVTVHIPYLIFALVDVISKGISPNLEPWPQVVERGCAALSVMAKSWESFMSEELEQDESCKKWVSGRTTICKALSSLLQRAWLASVHSLDADKDQKVLPPPSCIDDLSALLWTIMISVTGVDDILELRLSELLVVWADLIADWHAWEESEDISVFDCIKEVVNLQSKYRLNNFFVRRMPSPPAPPVPKCSVVENIGAFISEALLQYPSATWRACSCVHVLLHVPSYSFETEVVKQSLAIAFSQAAYCHFRQIKEKLSSLWKPLLLAISSCYICYPDIVQGVLEKCEHGGFRTWASSLGFLCRNPSECGLSAVSEIRLTVMAQAKVVERIVGVGNFGDGLLCDCFAALLEASIRLKEVNEENDEEDDDEESEGDQDDDDETEDDEDSDTDELGETEEEFLDRYAKVASALESSSLIEEGDVEDQDHEIELGCLEEIDVERVVFSLIDKHHHILIQGQPLSLDHISRFLNKFPEYGLFFQKSG